MFGRKQRDHKESYMQLRKTSRKRIKKSSMKKHEYRFSKNGPVRAKIQIGCRYGH